jgi:uridine kinase
MFTKQIGMDNAMRVLIDFANNNATRKLILVAGPTCAGKSHLVKLLSNSLESASIVVLDDYFRDIDDPDLPMIACRTTFDAPMSYHRSEIHGHVEKLMAGNDIECPVYSIASNRRLAQTKAIRSSAIIIVDGLFAIRELAVRYASAISVYVEAGEETRLKRRIKRNLETYGISEEATRRNFYGKVLPLQRMYVEPQRIKASIIAIGD